MHALNTRSLLALLVLTFAPLTLAAQQPAPGQQPLPQPQPAPQISTEVQGWILEAQQIQQRLEPIHVRALEDPMLREAQTELSGAIVVAMMQAGPEVQADLRRVETIQPELRAAQESGDQGQMERLVREAQQLQQRLAQAQNRVMQQPAIAAQVQDFESRLHARMIQIDPDAGAMIERLMALQAQILEAMQAEHPEG